jgi:hypothetical protein
MFAVWYMRTYHMHKIPIIHLHTTCGTSRPHIEIRFRCVHQKRTAKTSADSVKIAKFFWEMAAELCKMVGGWLVSWMDRWVDRYMDTS